MWQLKPLFGVVLALVLAGCSNPQYLIHPFSNPTAAKTRQDIDRVMDTTMPKPVAWGSFMFPPKGSFFKPVLTTDSRNAIVYVYRPQSSWGDAEVQAPGFFVNGEFISGLKSNSYFWFEVPSSNYNFVAKRPIAVIYFKTIFEVDATFEGGKRYYFKYDEENLGPKKLVKGSPMIALGPLQQVSETQALTEINQTRSMGVGRVLYADYQPQWAPFDLYANAAPVEAARLDSLTKAPTQVRTNEEIEFEQGAVDADGNIQAQPKSATWWNPTTWW